MLSGNGCSATQFVPYISDGANRVKKMTQFSRQAHWLSERPNPRYSGTFKAVMKYVPGAITLYRAWLYGLQEMGFSGFHIKNGASTREEWTRTATEYILKNSPKKYGDSLVPRTVIACKRRVMDTEYLAALHRDNVELVNNDPIHEIVEDGVITESGKFVKAEAIMLANGFETQKTLFPMEIRGEGGKTIHEHVSSLKMHFVNTRVMNCSGTR
jgi:cation diffusion facilitator CzcD-associated flavoprotein CzcO